MTSQEKSIVAKEKKQIKAFLSALRQQNTAIGQELAGLVEKIAKMREAQLGTELLIGEFEKRIK